MNGQGIKETKESRGANTSDRRRLDRESQTRSWAAPLPDFSTLPRASESPRLRLEWETRDTINNRLWNDTLTAGPKAVTSESLAAHPTNGAGTMMPSAARQDMRPYGLTHNQDFPSRDPPSTGPRMPGIQDRPGPPSVNLFKSPWLAGVNTESEQVAREMRGIVKESNAGRAEDTSGRLASRTFQNQWMSRQDVTDVVVSQIEAGERLRPRQDDYRMNFIPSLQSNETTTGTSW